MSRPPLGQQELALLRLVATAGPLSAAQALERFGSGYARTTVLTMLERLRHKGYLNRRRTGGAFQYSSRVDTGALLREQVRRFVDGTLDGSLSPFVAYLTEAHELSDQELEVLSDLLARLDAEPRGER